MEPLTIAAILSVSTLAAGGLNAASTSSANNKNLEMAMLQRKDTLAAQKISNLLSRENLALNKRQVDLSEENSAFAQKEATEQKGYNRMTTAYERAAKLLSENMSLSQAKAAPFQKYAPGRA